VLVDGAEGPRTGAAIRAEEERLGWPVTGRAGSKLLAALAASRPGTSACPVNR
jgi:peptidoglycan hydrolase-like protein with peptidoglycan-binding domain